MVEVDLLTHQPIVVENENQDALHLHRLSRASDSGPRSTMGSPKRAFNNHRVISVVRCTAFQPEFWERAEQLTEQPSHRFRPIGNCTDGWHLIPRMMKCYQRTGNIVRHGFSFDVASTTAFLRLSKSPVATLDMVNTPPEGQKFTAPPSVKSSR